MRTLACTVAAAALLLAAPVALAHQGNPNYRSVVKAVTPQTSGIDASILNFDDAVLVHNTSGKDVMILDYKKQPYVELKADGTVSVNTNSEALLPQRGPPGRDRGAQGPRLRAEVEEVSKSGRYEWHDHRMHWMGDGDPPNLTDKGKETVIDDNWVIPIQVAGAAGAITGTLTWVPLEDGGLPLGAIFAFAALIIVLSIAVFIVRRRRAGGRRRRHAGRARGEGARGGVVKRALALAALALALAARGRVRARDAAGDHPRARREARRRARRRSCSASTSRSRPPSARCASSTPRARRSRPARPSTPAAAARRSRSSSSPASATAPTPRPTASSPPTATRSPPASSSPSATRPRPRESLDPLLADGGTGPVTNTALAFARGFQYGAIALGLGALIFFLSCWRGASHAPSRAGSSGCCSSPRSPASSPRPLAVILQGAVGQGGTFWAAAKPDVVQRGARHPLRPRLGPRRARPGWSCSPCSRCARCAPAAGTRSARGGSDDDGGVAVVTRRRRPRPRSPPRAPRSRPSCSRSPSRSSRSRCCPRSAATPACRSRSRSCCPRTSCTCWR